MNEPEGHPSFRHRWWIAPADPCQPTTDDDIFKMNFKRLKPYAWMGLLFSTLMLIYSIFAVVMVASMSSAPNYTGDARRNALQWEAVLIVSLIAGAICVAVLLRARRRT